MEGQWNGEMKYRILYHYPFQQVDTGSPKVLIDMIRGLDRSVFEPLFVANGEGPLNDELSRHGVEIFAHPVTPIGMAHPIDGLRRVVRFARALKQWRVDLVHVNDLGWNLDLIAAAALRRIPVIQHIHNASTINFKNFSRILTDRFFIVSNAQRKFVDGFDYIEDRVETLYNSVDVDKVACGKSIRSDLGIAADQTVIGTIAQIRHTKGIDILLDTASRCLEKRDDLVFLVIGPAGRGHEDYAKEMRTRADGPEFSGRVRFLGSRSDIPDLLASMDVFFLPSRVEPFGIVVIEALAAGLPVVASHAGGISEIISEPEFGWLVEPNTVDSFVNTLHQVINLPDKGRSVGLCGRDSLEHRFSPEVIAAQLQSSYLDLLDDPRSTRIKSARRT